MSTDQPLEPRPPPGWRASRLLAGPFRLCFVAAGLIWMTSAGWWAAALLALPLPWRVPAALAHGLWFSLGALPLFIAGFMLTAGPKWLRRPPVATRELRVPVGACVLGWFVAAAGFHLAAPLAAAGLCVVLAGWALLARRIARLDAQSAHTDRRHPRLIVAACWTIAFCLALASLALATGRIDLLRAVTRVALWGGVTTIFLTVSHRMLPFLGDGTWPAMDGRWPDWPLWVVLSVPMMQCVDALSNLSGIDPAPWRVLRTTHLGFAAITCTGLSLRWLGERALRQPMVALLFGAFLWWDAALWLACAASGVAPGSPLASALGMSALHALTMGFLGSTLLVMATRISSSHNGRAPAMDRVARVLFAVLQIAVLLRLAAAFDPAQATMMLRLAALAWLAVALAWTVRHGRWLGSPRADGRPG